MIDREKILKKITKCLELGNSTNVNEAANAINMAHKLMLKYGLDKEDLEFIKMGMSKSKVLLPTKVPSHIIHIIKTINNKFGTEAVLTNYKGLKQLEFFGNAERTIFAVFAFEVIYRAMEEEVGEYSKILALWCNSSYSEYSNHLSRNERLKVDRFRKGWIVGALSKLPELTTEEDRDKTKDYLTEQFKDKKLDRESLKREYLKAMKDLTNEYLKGMKKGERLNINQGVSTSHNKMKLIEGVL